MTSTLKASFSWAARREGNLGYILETRPDGSTHEFGPMPAHAVPAFIDARRKFIRYMMLTSGHTPLPNAEPFDPRFLQ